LLSEEAFAAAVRACGTLDIPSRVNLEMVKAIAALS